MHTIGAIYGNILTAHEDHYYNNKFSHYQISTNLANKRESLFFFTFFFCLSCTAGGYLDYLPGFGKQRKKNLKKSHGCRHRLPLVLLPLASVIFLTGVTREFTV